MKIYLVGGAVRDELLGLPVGERDWVVVGATAEAMQAAGFVPADAYFPVFLHPESGEEYALARREVKHGEGYRGFVFESGPEVSLEEDLRRRDLTVNAMARDADGGLIDPYGGRDDLDAGLLRHVSPAFVEDPLRVLRIARFAASLGGHGFRVAHATHRLLCAMAERGEMRHLTAERLWREMYKAMQAAQPWRFFEVLHRCGALHDLIAPLATAMGAVTAHAGGADPAPMAVLRRAAAASTDAARRLVATLLTCVRSTAEADALMAKLRAGRNAAQLLHRACVGMPLWAHAESGDVTALADLAAAWRGFDAGSDIDALITVCEAQHAHTDVGRRLRIALPAARAVSVSALLAGGLKGPQLGQALAAARREAMRLALKHAGLDS